MLTNGMRITCTSVLIALALATSPLPARADFGLSFRVAVGSQPPPPPVTVATATDPDYPEPCGDKKLQWFVYGAQVLNAFVVSNAVRQGSRGATFFGTSRSVAPYIGEQAAEDVFVRYVTRRWDCRGRSITLGILGGSALVNTSETEFPHPAFRGNP
jgi:hypothetical protein